MACGKTHQKGEKTGGDPKSAEKKMGQEAGKGCGSSGKQGQTPPKKCK